jgi:elongation factor Ts
MSDSAISASEVKRLRDQTGAGMMQCKKALQESGGDFDRAQEILRERGLAGVEKRKGRVAGDGVVDSYIHGEGRIGVLVEVNCETDFVARTTEFRELAREVAMQVAGALPAVVSRDEVPRTSSRASARSTPSVPARKASPRRFWTRSWTDCSSPSTRRRCSWISRTSGRGRRVDDLVKDVATKVGENVVVRRFVRYQLGEEA